MAIDLIMLSRFGGPDVCVGAYVLDERAGPAVRTVLARATILASGGAGKVYLYTTNPDVATGDGVAMAYRAGAEIGNMEFYQFHPTCLFHPRRRVSSITEALRGEGAILRLQDGTAFMERHDARKDLAPRDIVARAIDFEMKRTGGDYVLLDITHKPLVVRARALSDHPRPVSALRHRHHQRADPGRARGPLHVRRHHHRHVTDARRSPGCSPSASALSRACTGPIASRRTRCSRGWCFGHRAALRLAAQIAELRASPFPDVPEWQAGDASASDEAVVVTHNWDELRRTMWNYVGIVRSNTRLRRAARRVSLLHEEIQEYYWKHLVTRDLLELRNIATVAELVIGCAAVRHESRGLHTTIDYPDTRPELAVDTVIKRGVPAYLRGR
jgi:L-aspartate oxidase